MAGAKKSEPRSRACRTRARSRGDGDGRGLQDAQGAGADGACAPVRDKIRSIAAHLAQANPEYQHPFLIERRDARRVGFIVVSTDKGLCGGLNTNVLRARHAPSCARWKAQGVDVDDVAIGNKGFGFLHRIGAKVVSHVTHLGDKPQLDS